MNKTLKKQEEDLHEPPVSDINKESADTKENLDNEESDKTIANNKFYKIAFDVYAYIQILIKKKWWILSIALTFGLFGVFCSFQIPKIYTSALSLAPESSKNGLSSNISSLASMVGMDMKFGNNDDAIYPEIYPDVVKSNKFIVSLFDIKVTTKDQTLTTTYYNYLDKYQKSAFWNKWIDAISKKIKKSDSISEKNNNINKVDTFQLTKKETDIANNISNSIKCSVDKKTSIITIQVTAQDPLIAATMADSVKVRLQDFIKEYRTQKARDNVAYIRHLYKEAKDRYDKARKEYAEYADAHQETVLQEYQSKQEDLENEMQLQYNIYTQCVQQLQLSLAKLQEQTPVFTEITQAAVPIKHSNTPKIVIVIVFIFVAIIGSLLYFTIANRKKIFRIVEITK